MATSRNKLKRTLRKELMRQQQRQHAGGARPAASPSRPTLSAPSRWHQAPADKRALAESVDGFAPLRNKLREVAELRSAWAGIPMPLEDEALIVEPRYPYAQGLMSMCGGAKDEAEGREEAKLKLRNSFWSTHKMCDILVIEKDDGEITFGIEPGIHHLRHDLRTLGCAEAWGIEQESKALGLLASMVNHRHFKQYLLTGMFLQTSKRSGVTYIFRRLKPTVAIVAEPKTGHMKILAALCLHPIGYYAGSWAGAMCPTDDVVAHLTLMRGDEALFWRRANQHPAWRPEAGL